jgi:hypothetical protein
LWSAKCLNDIKHLTEKENKVSVHHMRSIVDLSLLGKQNIASCLDLVFNIENDKNITLK